MLWKTSWTSEEEKESSSRVKSRKKKGMCVRGEKMWKKEPLVAKRERVIIIIPLPSWFPPAALPCSALHLSFSVALMAHWWGRHGHERETPSTTHRSVTMAFHAGSTNQTTDWRSWRIVPRGISGIQPNRLALDLSGSRSTNVRSILGLRPLDEGKVRKHRALSFSVFHKLNC